MIGLRVLCYGRQPSKRRWEFHTRGYSQRIRRIAQLACWLIGGAYLYRKSEKATRKYPKWRNRTSGCESVGRFWIGKPGFLFEFPSNHTCISLLFRRSRMPDRQTEGQRGNYYSVLSKKETGVRWVCLCLWRHIRDQKPGLGKKSWKEVRNLWRTQKKWESHIIQT